MAARSDALDLRSSQANVNVQKCPHVARRRGRRLKWQWLKSQNLVGITSANCVSGHVSLRRVLGAVLELYSRPSAGTPGSFFWPRGQGGKSAFRRYLLAYKSLLQLRITVKTTLVYIA